MDFEFIDEDQIEFSRQRKPKKTPSLFDTPLLDRSYWGYVDVGNGNKVLDPGTEIAIAMIKSRIRESIRKGYLLDVSDEARRLNNEFIQELIKYQFDYLFDLMSDGVIVARQNEDGKWVIENVEK